MPEQPFLFVATPCYGGQVNMIFLRSVLALQEACATAGIGLHVELLDSDPLITRARARLAHRFLRHTGATHMVSIDADIGFAPQNILRLLAAGRDLAGGVCPLKHIDWDKVRAAALAGQADLMGKSVGYVVRFTPTPDNSVTVEDGFANVSYVGTGVQMVRRETLQRICAAHPELTADLSDVEPDGSQVSMIFDTLVDATTGQHLSEDYAFCRRWRDLGGEIWADVQSRYTHVGHAAYSGSLIEAMRPG